MKCAHIGQNPFFLENNMENKKEKVQKMKKEIGNNIYLVVYRKSTF